ncbi:cytochrome P450, partial [Frankia sp. Cpl3]|nr:cytochrome P450 [Frankia sp. Cpl3]
DQFIPERFTGDLLKKLPQFAYFPFGGGPRVCIGNNFALMESALLLATIAQRFQLRLVENHPVEPEPLVTLRPKFGLRMKVELHPKK